MNFCTSVTQRSGGRAIIPYDDIGRGNSWRKPVKRGHKQPSINVFMVKFGGAQGVDKVSQNQWFPVSASVF